MKLYKDFDYKRYSGVMPFLINFPDKITNYDEEPFNTVYKTIESYLDSNKTGVMISSPNPVNVTSLLIPIALIKGVTYLNCTNLATEDDAFTDMVMKNDSLILDEIGINDFEITKKINKIVNYRFNNGLITYIGSCRDKEGLYNVSGYNAGLVSKILRLTSLKVHLSKYSDIFVESVDKSHTGRID